MEANAMQIFGLTNSQLKILYSLEKLMVEEDILLNDKGNIIKQHWLDRWSTNISVSLGSADKSMLLSKTELLKAISQEANQDMNRTWYYLVMLEAALFHAYTPLGESKDADKQYAKLKYKPQNKLLEEIVKYSGIMEPIYIQRFQKTYQKSMDKLTGKVQKVALGALSVVAVSAIAAATAGVMAGPIAVAMFGSNFVAHGAALTSACLQWPGVARLQLAELEWLAGLWLSLGEAHCLALPEAELPLRQQVYSLNPTQRLHYLKPRSWRWF